MAEFEQQQFQLHVSGCFCQGVNLKFHLGKTWKDYRVSLEQWHILCQEKHQPFHWLQAPGDRQLLIILAISPRHSYRCAPCLRWNLLKFLLPVRLIHGHPPHHSTPCQAAQLAGTSPLALGPLGAAQGAQPGRLRTAGSVRAGSAKEVCKLLVTLMLRSRADFPAFGESSCIQFMYGVTLIGHKMHFSHDENMHLSAVCCVQVGMLCPWLHGGLYGNKGCSALRACRSKQKRGSTARSGMCQELHLLLGVRDRHVSVSISLWDARNVSASSGLVMDMRGSAYILLKNLVLAPWGLIVHSFRTSSVTKSFCRSQSLVCK